MKESLLISLLLPHLNAKFYAGHIRWMMLRKVPYKSKTVAPSEQGYRNQGCLFCGNIANGTFLVVVHHLQFNVPICKSHCRQLAPAVESAPFYVRVRAQKVFPGVFDIEPYSVLEKREKMRLEVATHNID